MVACKAAPKKPKNPDLEVLQEEVIRCLNASTDLYGDLCAEARHCDEYDKDPNGYCTDKAADKRGSDTLLIENHWLGVKCATDFIRQCVGLGDD